MLALAVALRARGHVAVFAVPSNFLEWIRACGFDAASNGVDIEAAMLAPGAKLESLGWLFGRLKEQTAQMFEPVARASEGADAIVGAGAQLVTSSVAEWRDVPHANIAFCPCAIPTGGTPPPTVRTQMFPPWANRLLWQAGGSLADLGLRGTINRGRSTLGLRPIDSPLTHIAESCVILAADRDLAPLGDDAPPSAVSTDAWIFDEPHTPDPRVEAFLSLDPPPIYVGFGSMVSHHAAELSAHAVDAARAVGRRLMLIGGWAGLDRFVTAADDVLAVRAVSHATVLPRVALAVHHGGAGTTTAAARAGVPQVILPHILDQFYWAHRIERLGLGPRALPADLITADILTARIDAALHDPRIRARAAALGPVIAARNGVVAAVNHIEHLVAPGTTLA
jgi:UDP:flavonoid glycosyltransferase YjiC (YdhE family)